MKQNSGRWLAVALLAAALPAQSVDLVPVVSKPASRTVELPGEIAPFLSVALHAKVTGFVEKILVDRGSVVKEGQFLAELSAPELKAQIAEAESKAMAAESERLQAQAQAAAAASTYERLKQASATPGAIAGNELVLAEKQAAAMQALAEARRQGSAAAASAAQSLKDMEAYLRITAPFDGTITDRLVHPGALVGPGAAPGSDSALLLLQQISRLRLAVAVPEESAGGIVTGARVEFRAPAFPGRVFSGTIARAAHALDPKTRTMPVELDVVNRDGALAPGMYATVKWPVRRAGAAALFVPATSVVTTTERTFVIREKNGRAEWVDVKKGAADGDAVEVLGALEAGDKVVKRATDEIRNGSPLAVKK